MVHSGSFFCGIFLFLYNSLLRFWVKTCYRFIPFSGGPRKCVGDQFALMEAIVALAIFLQHMNFELVPDQNVSMTTGATIHTTNVRLYNCFFVMSIPNRYSGRNNEFSISDLFLCFANLSVCKRGMRVKGNVKWPFNSRKCFILFSVFTFNCLNITCFHLVACFQNWSLFKQLNSTNFWKQKTNKNKVTFL